MAKSPEVSTFRYAKRSLMAYLDGERSREWILGVIEASGARGERLSGIFNELRDYPDELGRYGEVLEACQKRGWL